MARRLLTTLEGILPSNVNLCSSGSDATLAGAGGPSNSLGDAHATGDERDMESETLEPTGLGPFSCGFFTEGTGSRSDCDCSAAGAVSGVASIDGFVTR